MVAFRSTLLAAAVTLLVPGCAKKNTGGGPAVGVSDAHTVGMAAPSDTQEVLASTHNAELRVRLDKDLGHTMSRDGERFTARVVAPLAGKNGKLVVPAQAIVHGHVVHVAELDRRIEIRFDQIATPEANYRVDADVVRVEPSVAIVPQQGTTPTAATTVTLEAPPAATGGGPREKSDCPEPQASDNAEGVILPAGSELQLVLRQPLTIATTGIVPRRPTAE